MVQEQYSIKHIFYNTSVYFNFQSLITRICRTVLHSCIQQFAQITRLPCIVSCCCLCKICLSIPGRWSILYGRVVNTSLESKSDNNTTSPSHSSFAGNMNKHAILYS